MTATQQTGRLSQDKEFARKAAKAYKAWRIANFERLLAAVPANQQWNMDAILRRTFTDGFEAMYRETDP